MVPASAARVAPAFRNPWADKCLNPASLQRLRNQLPKARGTEWLAMRVHKERKIANGAGGYHFGKRLQDGQMKGVTPAFEARMSRFEL